MAKKIKMLVNSEDGSYVQDFPANEYEFGISILKEYFFGSKLEDLKSKWKARYDSDKSQLFRHCVGEFEDDPITTEIEWSSHVDVMGQSGFSREEGCLPIITKV